MKDDTQPANHVGEPPADASDVDFLARVSAKLPPDRRRDREALERVKAVYVECNRDKVVSEAFGLFLTEVLAMRNGRRDDGRAFFVTGQSGAGKSLLVERMLDACAPLAPMSTAHGPVKPLVTVNLMGPSTLKWLGIEILAQAGYQVTRKLEQGEVWSMLPRQLHLRKVLVIHIDETQHMLKQAAADQERANLAKAFKGVMNYRPWPVSFVMSGMPETVELARLDEQIERRASFQHLPDVTMPGEESLVRAIVRQLSSAAGLEWNERTAGDLTGRVAHAARYRYGRIAQVVVAAVAQALSRKSVALTRQHFALAYIDHSHARGRNRMNPFIADDWLGLEPGSFLLPAEAK